ncbi:peptide ABC transporter substrate-binding protein [Alkaliphilus transvaalensis]|uniref:peptide ABC transporter substrate-binding protein n=1 Tax=Alkaliphilus transvaalensis TaxID=114628 RepID=UPI00047931BB|nr:peptide ABC transporter substrate-binding protein [Alkaliphilus transvaalensis]
MNMSKNIYIILILIIALSFTACSGQLLPDETFQEDEEEEIVIENYDPAEGGNLKLAVTRFNTANPLFNSNKSLQQFQHLVFEGLVAFNHEMDLEPALAENWTISPDGQSIDFALRKDVRWHDGQPFTSQDVIFTFQAIKGTLKDLKGTSIYRGSLQQVSDMKAIDDDIVRVTFTRPFSNGLEVMTFPILPKHLFEGNKIITLNNEDFPLVGTGPYQLEGYQRMKKIQLKKNNNYWGQKPYIDTVEVLIVPDVEAKLSLFENGDVDVARPTSIDWGRYADNRRVNAYEFVSNDYEFIGFNFRNKLLQNEAVRKAFAYGVDRHAIVRNVYLNNATVTDVPINPQLWLYSDEAGVQYGYSVDTANALLEGAGFTKDYVDLYRKNEAGETLTFKLITNKGNTLREKTAYFIKDEMAAIGIKIEVEFLEWEDFNEAISRGNFDILLGGWELAPVPDLTFAFHSSQIGGTNYIAYNNEEMDTLLENASRARNRQEKLETYQKLQFHIANELPYLSLFFQNNGILVRDHVKGEKHPHDINIYKGIENWYINTKIIQ